MLTYGDRNLALNEHTPSQPFFAGAAAGDENSVLAECAICARPNAYEAVTDYAG